MAVAENRSFAVATGAIYYRGCEDSGTALHRLDLATGRDRIPGKLENPVALGHTVSADGETVLTSDA